MHSKNELCYAVFVSDSKYGLTRENLNYREGPTDSTPDVDTYIFLLGLQKAFDATLNVIF